jgi:hypothetical protein
MTVIRRLADSIVKTSNNPTSNDPIHRRVWAVVVAIQMTPVHSLTLHISGNTTTPIPGIRYLSSYSPTVTDVVIAEFWGSDLVVLGRMA